MDNESFALLIEKYNKCFREESEASEEPEESSDNAKNAKSYIVAYCLIGILPLVHIR